MVAYAFLALEKDAIRGVTVSMQSIVILIRMYALTTTKGSVFDWESESLMYAKLVVCAWAGLALGGRLREHCDSRAILHILNALLLVSAASMLGMFEQSLATSVTMTVIGVTGLALLLIISPKVNSVVKSAAAAPSRVAGPSLL